MKKKTTEKTKHIRPARRQSFSGFSQSYAGGLTGNKRSYGEKVKRRNKIKWTLAAIGFISLFVAAFVFTDIMLDISQKPAETSAPVNPAGTTAPAVTLPAPVDREIHAVMTAAEVLDGGKALEDAIALIKKSSANAAVIEFKDANGYLAYKTALTDVPKASDYARSAPAESIKALQAQGIAVIAKINCFKDPLAAWAMRGAAVHYMGNSNMLWIDSSLANGGKPWLNPYSEQAVSYLTGIVKELAKTGVDYILLDTVQYPGASLILATFDGEEEPGAPGRNKILLDFIDAAAAAAGKTSIICAMEADAALNGGSKLYSGDLWKCAAGLFAVDLREAGGSAALSVPRGKKAVLFIDGAAVTAPPDYIKVFQ